MRGVLLTDFETRCILLWEDVPGPEEALANVDGDEGCWLRLVEFSPVDIGEVGEITGETEGGGRVSC